MMLLFFRGPQAEAADRLWQLIFWSILALCICSYGTPVPQYLGTSELLYLYTSLLSNFVPLCLCASAPLCLCASAPLPPCSSTPCSSHKKFTLNSFTAMAIKIIPKTRRRISMPAWPSLRSIQAEDFNTKNTKNRLTTIPTRMLASS